MVFHRNRLYNACFSFYYCHRLLYTVLYTVIYAIVFLGTSAMPCSCHIFPELLTTPYDIYHECIEYLVGGQLVRYRHNLTDDLKFCIQ